MMPKESRTLRIVKITEAYTTSSKLRTSNQDTLQEQQICSVTSRTIHVQKKESDFEPHG